jgi:tRNA (guanine37-N1)-methyltransferase
MAIRKTLENRPDLLERANLSEQDQRLLREVVAERADKSNGDR